jgi:lysyl oxidase
MAASENDADQPIALCGGPGEPCCTAPLPACSAGLTCDPAAGSCAPAAADAGSSRLCRSSGDCAPGTTCCPAGYLRGTCEPLEPAACPLPDLTVLLEAGAGLEGVVDVLEIAPDDCRLQLGCAGAAGKRRILSFPDDYHVVVNTGAADLILGDPATSPSFRHGACGAYMDGYLRYALIDAAGSSVASGSGQPTCDTPGSRFDCEFLGVDRWNSTALPLPDDTRPPPPSPPCAGVDITDVPPGSYTLRITVNPDRTLPESDYENNAFDLRVQVPSWTEPAQACPEVENRLFGDATSRECGWIRSGAAEALSCTPGQVLALGCPECLTDPMLRVCEGSEPCPALAALAAARDSVIEQDMTSSTDCSTGTCPTSACPFVRFTCPASGLYSNWVSFQGGVFYAPDEPVDCNVSVQP